MSLESGEVGRYTEGEDTVRLPAQRLTVSKKKKYKKKVKKGAAEEETKEANRITSK